MRNLSNWSTGEDTQLQKAALRHELRAGCLQR